jgi:hypothetical protein
VSNSSDASTHAGLSPLSIPDLPTGGERHQVPSHLNQQTSFINPANLCFQILPRRRLIPDLDLALFAPGNQHRNDFLRHWGYGCFGVSECPASISSAC